MNINSLNANPNKPEIKIDKVLLETLCGYQAPLQEIASILKTKQKTVREFVKTEYNTDWKRFYAEKSAIGKSKLRENQFNLAKKSPDMAKYLASKYLTDNENEALQEALEKLTPKKKKFADKLLECEDQTEAAKFAGYKGKTVRMTASKLVKEGGVAEYLRLMREKTSRKLEISKEKYLEKLNLISEEALEIKEQISAIKVIGKWQGYEAPVKVAGHDGGPISTTPPPIDYSIYTLEELKTLQTLLTKQKKPDDQQKNHNSWAPKKPTL